MAALAPVSLQSRQKNRLRPVVEPRIPEPAQLYSVVVLAFVVHVPVTNGGVCVQCKVLWPCPSVRLAYRLREAF